MISRFIAVLLGLIATALLILLIIIVLGQQQAYAHEWFTNSGCCDGDDCKPWIPTPQNFTPVDGGYHIKLTRDELLQINPGSHCPEVDEIVPMNSKKIKDSPVSSFGLCIKYYAIDDGTCVRCLFVPGDI
jgi:hypothetical protein